MPTGCQSKRQRGDIVEGFVGIDVGSLTTKIVVLNNLQQQQFATYLRTEGGPIQAIQQGMQQMLAELGERLHVLGVGTTGSGRHLAAVMVGADTIKNEITAHAVAARKVEPRVRTVIDIGGQDSKVIYMKNGISTGFNMNSVCAAGTGSFLDHQANRLGVPIERFGELALKAKNPVRIAGRCGVFAESDLIHKQQMGYQKEDLIAGLCLALARNYLTNVVRSREVQPVILFQGGVAANLGIKAAFEALLGQPVIVPPDFKVMGAIGAALLAQQYYQRTGNISAWRGLAAIVGFKYQPRSFICGDCANDCEISELYIDSDLVSRWGSKCAKWDNLGHSSAQKTGQQENLVKVSGGPS